MTQVNIGLGANARKQVAESLARVLAETYTLYLKTQNYHWNVTGSMFQPLHEEFQKQYTDLAGAIDELAERIRALGFPAPGSFKRFSELSLIKEAGDKVPAAKEMLKTLLKDHEMLIKTAREALEVADAVDDDVTEDLVIGRLAIHEKTAWMIRSFLK